MVLTSEKMNLPQCERILYSHLRLASKALIETTGLSCELLVEEGTEKTGMRFLAQDKAPCKRKLENNFQLSLTPSYCLGHKS